MSNFYREKEGLFKKIRKHFNFLYLSLNNIRLSSLNKSTSPASQEIQIHHPSIAQAKTGKFYSNFPTWFLAEVVDPEPRAELLPPPVEPKGRAAEQTEQNRPENHRPVIFVHFSHFFPTRHNNRKDDSLRSRREHCSPSAFPISVRILSSIFFFCLLCAGRRAVSIFSSSFLSRVTQSEQHTRDTFCPLLLWHKGIWGHSRKEGLKSSSSRSLWISRITPLEKKPPSFPVGRSVHNCWVSSSSSFFFLGTDGRGGFVLSYYHYYALYTVVVGAPSEAGETRRWKRRGKRRRGELFGSLSVGQPTDAPLPRSCSSYLKTHAKKGEEALPEVKLLHLNFEKSTASFVLQV